MIISVWGNNGCGSSTLAIKLGLALSEKGKNVVLVDANFVAPQTKIWFPKINFNPEDSMSVILANNIELDNVASKITMINDYFGVLGYGKELSINAIPSRDDTPSELLSVLSSISDIVIIDCQSNITQDIMSFMALDVADTKLINLSPDIRGIAWYNANVMMLKEKWLSQNAQIYTIFNKVKINAPVDAVEKAIGTVDFYLPYADEIEEELYSGKIGEKYFKGQARNYGVVIKNIAESILDYMDDDHSSGVIIKKSSIKEEPIEEPVNTPIEEPINKYNKNNFNEEQLPSYDFETDYSTSNKYNSSSSQNSKKQTFDSDEFIPSKKER